MSYNDRLSEVGRWVRSHLVEGPDTTVVVELRARELAELLSEGSHDPSRVPMVLGTWAREHASLGSGMSVECWRANADPDDPDEVYDVELQVWMPVTGSHAACDGSSWREGKACTCACHQVFLSDDA